jgi:hypothetical protein
MVFIVIKYWYPSHKQEEVAKIFQKNVTNPQILSESQLLLPLKVLRKVMLV